MIGVVDYNMGNLGSVLNTCAWLGVDVKLVDQPAQLEGLDGLIVPGQGAFRDCMRHLREYDFVDPLREWIEADKPFFGICMGLQVLFEKSEESPGEEGLCVFPGEVKRFEHDSELKVPHMGWNQVQWTQEHAVSAAEELQEAYFYFVHSYYVPMVDADWVWGSTDYGHPYVSAVRRGNCFAAQFHPEKSQKAGLALLKGFAEHVG